ncbi:CDP-alcohol phosphatidyltransferase family protein [Candidatus Phytoplasma bonamiae]|uniref:CDP-alcohol phosphatidyltransferase family protein n=1 Tax=Candidatus Phytoplasma bonamiae TaxID=2982626 RepID=A0ABT9D4C7_9MOLU|nr:CDP-alcohol phosphatidyltransferase family protein ['Bonamia sp.' little leaf phytoplasma]MDO8064078.1 CDP-alcohol phosphatidyltransferase family protein ['Bonamia sp.' little leaf phytoplasma]MDV3174534.1 CDP-alcohol phosphatidyltransferase family protein ['Bonamia sp.' little leaf phytoplasma]
MFLGIYNYTVYLTYLNLLSGFLGMIFATQNKVIWACVLLLLSGILDVLDGIISRCKKNRSLKEKKYGIQIDSLADLISFGMLPIFIGISFYKKIFHKDLDFKNYYDIAFILISCLYLLASLIRLAYFNVLNESSKKKSNISSFIGVPVTVASIIFPLLVLLFSFDPFKILYWDKIFISVYVFCLMLLSFLFISDKLHFNKPDILGILLILCLLLIIMFIFVFINKNIFFNTRRT